MGPEGVPKVPIGNPVKVGKPLKFGTPLKEEKPGPPKPKLELGNPLPLVPVGAGKHLVAQAMVRLGRCLFSI